MTMVDRTTSLLVRADQRRRIRSSCDCRQRKAWKEVEGVVLDLRSAEM